MGSFGKIIFDTNFKLFGILSYIYPLGILCLWQIYLKGKTSTLRLIEIYLGSIVLFALLLILQALTFQIGIGNAITSALSPKLGNFGLWILSLFGLSVCYISLSNQDILYCLKRINSSKIKSSCQKIIKIFYRFCLTQFQRQFIKLRQIQKPRAITTFSPTIKLQSSPLLPNLSPHNPSKQKTTNQRQEFVMPKNEKINIQEFIVSSDHKEQTTTIRVLEEVPQQKENPFLKNPLAIHSSQGISTSAELLKKIKNQTHQEQNNLTNQESQPLQESVLHSKSIPPKMDISTLQENLSDQNDENPSLTQSLKETEEQELQEQELENLEPKNFENHDLLPHSFSHLQAKTKHFPPKSKIAHIKSLEENEALLKEIDQGKIIVPKDYKLPSTSLLSQAPQYENEIDENEIDSKIQSLLEKLSVFKIDGDVIRTYSGPIITTLEFRPAPNVKVSRIQSLENDIAMALEAKSIRIQAPIPGKNVVGIEIPNSNIQTIYLREVFESEIFKNSSSPLTLALGKDVVGNPFVTDLKKLPHLLIAGTTGSGKSVGVNAMILSLLYRNSPEDLKLMMVDPKMVEFMPYNDLPHLITPIITDPKKAVIGLANAVKEMERRYTLMSQSKTKEIVSYNQKAQEYGFEKFPYFVIIIDELADLMMTAGKEVEYSMARIAQMGRASGMHLIVATQSPRAEVLTGLIKTNLPAHLSYKVGSKIDAGIIGCSGAESLLGRGDMLFTPPGVSGLVRLHAPWSSEDEVSTIVEYIKAQRETLYDPQFLPEEKELLGALDDQEIDGETTELLEKAKAIILQDGKTSISYLQRRLSIGYNKAATLIETLEKIGFLSAPDTRGNRQIL